jgi:hypothetical protein
VSVPGTSSYLPNRARIVQLALTRVGALGPGVVNAAQEAAPLVAHANDELNILTKSGDADGILTWRLARRTLTTVANQAAYVLSDDVNDIDPPARYTVSGQTSGSVISPMSNDDYQSLGDRTITGVSNMYLVTKALDGSGLNQLTLTLYPVPANTGDTIEYQAVVRARDQTTDADTMDIPQMWISVVAWGLAAVLAPSYGLDMARIQYFDTKYENERQKLLEQDGERGPVQFVPFGAMSYGPYYQRGRGTYR